MGSISPISARDRIERRIRDLTIFHAFINDPRKFFLIVIENSVLDFGYTLFHIDESKGKYFLIITTCAFSPIWNNSINIFFFLHFLQSIFVDLCTNASLQQLDNTYDCLSIVELMVPILSLPNTFHGNCSNETALYSEEKCCPNWPDRV